MALLEASKLVAEGLGEFEASAARYCYAVRSSPTIIARRARTLTVHTTLQ